MSRSRSGKNNAGRNNAGRNQSGRDRKRGNPGAANTPPAGRPGGGKGGKLPPNPLTEQKRRRLSPGVVVVGLLLLALAAGVGVQYWRSNSGVDVSKDHAAEPPMITGPGTPGKGVTVGTKGAKAQIDLYLDYRCSHCKDFEDEAGETIDELVDQGRATVTYNPLMFVNQDASPRLANAFACAAAAGKARAYNDELYAGYAKAWSTDQLLELGKDLGITDPSFAQCVRDNSQLDWLESVGKAADVRGVDSTPTVFVNNKRLPEDQLTSEGVEAAVNAAG